MGMLIEDHARAEHQLATLNYYRLSGYWHTMRRIDPGTKASLDGFREGASFDLVVNLYRFDERLRNAIFADLARVELALRALIGHRLGAIDPLIHLDTAKLGPPAQQPDRNNPTMTAHKVWLHHPKSHQPRIRATHSHPLPPPRTGPFRPQPTPCGAGLLPPQRTRSLRPPRCTIHLAGPSPVVGPGDASNPGPVPTYSRARSQLIGAEDNRNRHLQDGEAEIDSISAANTHVARDCRNPTTLWGPRPMLKFRKSDTDCQVTWRRRFE